MRIDLRNGIRQKQLYESASSTTTGRLMTSLRLPKQLAKKSPTGASTAGRRIAVVINPQQHLLMIGRALGRPFLRLRSEEGQPNMRDDAGAFGVQEHVLVAGLDGEIVAVAVFGVRSLNGSALGSYLPSAPLRNVELALMLRPSCGLARPSINVWANAAIGSPKSRAAKHPPNRKRLIVPCSLDEMVNNPPIQIYFAPVWERKLSPRRSRSIIHQPRTSVKKGNLEEMERKGYLYCFSLAILPFPFVPLRMSYSIRIKCRRSRNWS